MTSIASWCYRNKWWVLLFWIVGLLVISSAERKKGTNYTNNFKLPHTQSFDAIKLLQDNAKAVSGDTEQVVFAVKSGKVTDPAVKQKVATLLTALSKSPNVGSVSNPYTSGKEIAPSGTVGFANVVFDVSSNNVSDDASKAFVTAIQKQSTANIEFQVEGQIAEQGQSPGGDASLFIGIIFALVVMLVVFGSLAAALVPLLTTLIALGAATSLVGLLSNVFAMPPYSSQLALLIGLGVGVDYSLFIVTRYRQAVMRGRSRHDAAVEALDTSGRAVFFAGTIVVIAVLGMFALGVSFLHGVAIAAAITVAFTVLTALTLGPALLSWFGNANFWGQMRPKDDGLDWILGRRGRRQLAAGPTQSDVSRGWARWTNWMQKRPVVFAAVAALVMLVLAAPFLSMRLGSVDAGSDPSSSTTRKAYDLLAKGFGPGYNGPLQLVAKYDSSAQKAAFSRAVKAAGRDSDAVSSTKPTFIKGTDGRANIATADITPKGSPQDASTQDLVNRLRKTTIPQATQGSGLHVLVGGDTAVFDDFAHVLTRKLPLFIGIVVVLSFLLLMVVFRSLMIPLVAAVMNMLSAGACFGVLTAIFQKGWGASVLGAPTGPVEAFLPVLVFPIVFGLSMDYEVFLISRIYEEWNRTHDNRAAVTHGLAATGRIITAAAIIMVLAFGSFVLAGQLVIEQFGIGLAGAVLLDALIVRSALVPALMLLIGRANWALPGWLDRILPHLNVEGSTNYAEPERPSVPVG